MKKAKILTSIILAGILVFANVVAAFAAPPSQGSYISGEVTNIFIDTTTVPGETTVVLTLDDTRIYRFSVQTALELTIVYYDNGVLVADEEWIGWFIDEINPGTVLPEPPTPPVDEEPQHPVGSALDDFFSEDIDGLDYDLIMDAHEAGAGFGLIAQALWLTLKLGGDASLFGDILLVKQGGDYEAFFTKYNVTFDEGEVIPSNWGQFRKVLAGDKKDNLGSVMSSRNDGTDQGNPANTNANENRNKNKSNQGNGDEHSNEHANGSDNRP